MFKAKEIPPKHQIYCNRSLNMNMIKAVGFDMDYTLALYRPETFEALAYDQTIKKLVSSGYPQEILQWKFDSKYMIRGLAIDKARGNIFKMDRHRYIKVAYHGFRELLREERKSLYDAAKILSYEEPDFALIDTLFTLADAYLFSQLVELKDKNPQLIAKSYPEIFRDVRAAIDMCHRDGSIKLEVMANPSRYIIRDPELINTLDMFRQAGRKLFLVTNSLWDYTHAVMNYLFGNDEAATLNEDWTQYFDMIITGASKPLFFMSQQVLYEVDTLTGLLRNTNGLMGEKKIFQGGNFKHLHTYLNIELGSQILYVGDHIYGDILRSKKELGWRTMLVINELEHELEVLHSRHKDLLDFEEQMNEKDRVIAELQHYEFMQQRNLLSGKKGAVDTQKRIDELSAEKAAVREELRSKLRSYHSHFHPVWGELMKTGHQNSRFAAQVENYACLYTSRLSNLSYYSPTKSFRSTRDLMPHDIFATH